MNRMNIFKLCVISTVCVSILYSDETRGAALAEMENLLKTEAFYLKNLESYIASQDEKIAILRRRAADFRNEHQLAEVNPDYVSNPMNTFLLTKRLTKDWKSIETIVATNTGSAEYLAKIAASKQFLKLPTDEGLTDAALTLVRLQDIYSLDTSSVASGKLNGIQYSTEMTSNDCFEIGVQLYNKKDYHYTISWMIEAMNRLETDKNRSNVSKSEILEYLSISSYQQGNISSALQYTNDILDILPDDEKANGSKVIYEKILKGELTVNRTTTPQLPAIQAKANETLLYKKLCRNEIHLPPAESSKLKCKYVTNRSPFLKIAPLKLEEACLKPYIVIYHNVLSDVEIDVIKTVAKPRFTRAITGNGKNGGVLSDYRIANSAWLEVKEHKIIQNINVRVEDMTGLLVGKRGNRLQVAYYGIGGQYLPHLDFQRNSDLTKLNNTAPAGGNPIVTVLFYMNHVAQGGATVFPELKLTLWPKKGSAAFWYNYHSSGKGDHSTLHAACPVLVGSKWVSNKWLHQVDQKILRPYKQWQTASPDC